MNNYRGWHWQFVNAWNSEIDRLNPRKDSTTSNCPITRAKQQLQEFPKAFYIWGLTGSFKTSFVKWIFGNSFFCIIHFHKYKLNKCILFLANYYEAGQVFTALFGPDNSTKKKQYAAFNAKLHSLALLDEFDFEYYDVTKWKLVVEGHTFPQEQKYFKPENMTMEKCSIEILSNLDPRIVRRIYGDVTGI